MEEISSGIDLTTGSHLRNLVRLSLPIMISNFMQTFYNLTDTFWLGKLGESARDAVSIAGIAFPIMFFFLSFGTGLVVAGTAMISRYRGAKDSDKIKEMVGQSILIFTVFAVLFIVISLFSLDYVLTLLQTPPEILSLTRSYMQVTITSLFFMFVFLAFQSFSHGLGDTMAPMRIQLVTLTLNVLIDPLMIFGLLFFPKFGIMGAAYATFICRFITAILCLLYFIKKYPAFIPKKHELIPNYPIIKKILIIALPASISQSTISFGFMILQGFVNSYGTVVISINAIGNRMVSLFMMPAMGLSNGLAAIVGQNMGANNIKRIYHSVKHALGLVMLIMVSGGLIMFFFGNELTRFFINDPEVILVGNRMFRITAVASAFFAVLFVFSGVFNGAGQTIPAMVFNLIRFWAIRVPLVYLLSGKLLPLVPHSDTFLSKSLTYIASPLSTNPYDALWWSMLISNILASLIAAYFYKKGLWKKGFSKS